MAPVITPELWSFTMPFLRCSRVSGFRYSFLVRIKLHTNRFQIVCKIITPMQWRFSSITPLDAGRHGYHTWHHAGFVTTQGHHHENQRKQRKLGSKRVAYLWVFVVAVFLMCSRWWSPFRRHVYHIRTPASHEEHLRSSLCLYFCFHALTFISY